MGETRGYGQRGKLGSGREGTEQIMTPAYEIRAVGNKNRQKFMCEVLKKIPFAFM